MKNWAAVVGYEYDYIVSDEGDVKSIKHCRRGKHPRDRNYMLRPIRKSNGHLYVNLCSNGVVRSYAISHLVINAFKYPFADPSEIKYVIHKDGDVTNNHVNNLLLSPCSIKSVVCSIRSEDKHFI